MALKLHHSGRTPTPPQLLAALLRKASVLRKLDHDLIEEQINLERSGHQPTERQPAPDYEVHARKLLNGHGALIPTLVTGGEGARPADVIMERKAIALALGVLQKEEVRTSVLALAEWLSLGGEDKWLANRRKLADAIARVREAVTDAQYLRSEAQRASGGAPLELPGDFGDKPLLSSDAQKTLEAIRGAGIIE
jgi:hypothetical protein